MGFRHSQHAGLLANQDRVVELPVAADGRREEVPPLEGDKRQSIEVEMEGGDKSLTVHSDGDEYVAGSREVAYSGGFIKE